MKRFSAAVAVCVLSLSAWAGGDKKHDKSTSVGTESGSTTMSSSTTTIPGSSTGTGGAGAAAEQKTCGQMMAEDAKYQREFGSMMSAIVTSWDHHAKVMAKTPGKEAKAEVDAINKLSKKFREQADTANKLAKEMEGLASLPSAPHDMKNLPPEQIAADQEAIKRIRAYGQLLIQGADKWEQGLKAQTGTGGSGNNFEWMEGEMPK